MRTQKYTNADGRVAAKFKSNKLTDCIIKVESGAVIWRKYEIHHLHGSKHTYIIVMGDKPNFKTKYTYTAKRCEDFTDIIKFVRTQPEEFHPILITLVRGAFDILNAGKPPKKTKGDRAKYERVYTKILDEARKPFEDKA